MKVLLLAENWEPQVGGIENYLTHVVEYLGKIGHEVTVVAPRTRIKNPHFAKASRGKKESGIRNTTTVIRRRFFWPIIKPAWLPLLIWIKKKAIREKWEVTLCSKALFEGMIGLYLKKKLGIPYVVFTYGMEISEWQKTKKEGRKLMKVLKGADAVVCINNQIKKVLVELGAEESKVVKIWPGVDDKFLADVPEKKVEQVLKKYDIDQPYVISVGRLIERKGFDDLIEAYSELDQTKFGDIKLVIVGDGPMLNELEELAEKLWVDTSVEFLTDVPDEDIPALYAGSELFALTPKEIEGDIEGFGIVYLEAAAQGIPAIATNTGGVKEAVIDGGTGLLANESNADEIRQGIENLLGDKEMRGRLGNQAKDRVESDFRWETRIKLVDKVIDGKFDKR